MKFYFTENYINRISNPNKVKFEDNSYLIYVATMNAIGKVRDMNFQALGKKRAN